jgi:ABC-type lipoprotein export system ATPase subunit
VAKRAFSEPLLLAAALIIIRCYPYPLRLVVRLAARRRAAVPFLGLTRAARAGSVSVLPVLILLPALAVSVFASVVSGGIADAQRLASWQQAGAPLRLLRRDVVGFVFQSFGLIPVLSAAENVGVPMRLTRTPAAEREERVRVLLALVGLERHADQRPYELSGGQRQRVAIARSLANRPRLLVADEPTGQLDSQTGRQIMELLRALVRSEGVTALVATHDPALITLADRVLEIGDGLLRESTPATP